MALLPFFLPTGIQKVADRYAYVLILPVGALLFSALARLQRRLAYGNAVLIWCLFAALFVLEFSVVSAHHALFANDRLFWNHAFTVHPRNEFVLANCFASADDEERRALYPLLPLRLRQREEPLLLLEQGQFGEGWSLLQTRRDLFTPLELAQRQASLLARAIHARSEVASGTSTADLLIETCARSWAQWREPVFLYGLALGNFRRGDFAQARDHCEQVISKFGPRTKYGLQATQLLEAMSHPAESVPDPK
jgi:hypothetical protein